MQFGLLLFWMPRLPFYGGSAFVAFSAFAFCRNACVRVAPAVPSAAAALRFTTVFSVLVPLLHSSPFTAEHAPGCRAVYACLPHWCLLPFLRPMFYCRYATAPPF
jgi:hypothetical protein